MKFLSFLCYPLLNKLTFLTGHEHTAYHLIKAKLNTIYQKCFHFGTTYVSFCITRLLVHDRLYMYQGFQRYD